jgi:TonB family protein
MSLRLLALLFLLAGYIPACDWFAVRIEAPRYPPLGTQARLTGMVRLKLSLTENGEVSSVNVLSGHPLLARVARDNIRLWKFVYRCSDTPNPARNIEFTYDFQLNGEIDACPRTRFRYEHPYKVTLVSEALHWTP